MHRLLLVVALASGILLTYGAQAALRSRAEKADKLKGNTRLYIPEGRSLRALALGQQTSLADLYWLRFVQYVGTPDLLAAGLPQALELADLITDVDPLYAYAYQAAGVALATTGQIENSNSILEKGLEYVPARWQIPFYLSFNYWYEQKDLEKGATMLERAAALPTAPEFVPRLVARLYSAAGQARAAKEYFQAMLQETEDPGVRAVIEERIATLHMEIDLVLLDEAIARYRADHGTYPAQLEELVGHALVAVPVAPNGLPYRYDATTGRVLPPEGARLSREIPKANVATKVELK